MVSNCNYFHLVVTGDTCYDLAAANSITQTQFYDWNPAVGSSCAGLDTGYYVCVGISGNVITSSSSPSSSSHTITSTSSRSSSSSAAGGVTTPTPTQVRFFYLNTGSKTVFEFDQNLFEVTTQKVLVFRSFLIC
jgi:hypothetical protein